MSEGRLAIVLHSHLPYVEGFGTWPFGEEWVWEAIATSYLPLLEVLRAGAPVTLSLTPVLCDQLEAPGAIERCRAFLRDVRPASHALDVEAADDVAVAAELERAAGEYALALQRLPDDLLSALAPFAAWTSSATHAVLPLLATDAGLRLQVRTGVESHRARFGDGWRGGFWLPECAQAPWLHACLEEAGVHATCVDLTDVFGPGDGRHLRPLATAAGPLLVPIDRAAVDLVWSPGGYPAHAAYRDHHHRTARDHHPWANDGAVYDPARAAEQAASDAADFVARVAARVAGGGLCVCALDTELLGHWWYEGVHWLAAVLEESARQGLALTRLDDALERHEPGPPPARMPVSSWGDGGDLRTWSGPRAAELAWSARTAELRLAAMSARPPDRALRELLALQSSDWAFLHSRAIAGDYPVQRARGHLDALTRALAGDPDLAAEPALRGLAPDLGAA
jgi:1,4-alpha-glucan branching enzyme